MRRKKRNIRGKKKTIGQTIEKKLQFCKRLTYKCNSNPFEFHLLIYSSNPLIL